MSRFAWQTVVLTATGCFLASVPSFLAHAHVQAQTPRGIAYVAVSDAKGRHLAGLNAADVRVRVDGRDRPVLDIRPATDSPAIVIIVDGYTDAAALQVRRALHSVLDLVRATAPDAHVGLMLAEGALRPVLSHVNDDAATLNRLAETFVQSGASAPMMECISVAARALGEAASKRRMILLLTSQTDSVRSTLSPESVGEAVRRSGASLWALQSSLPTRNRQGAVESERVLKTVTRASGGRLDRRLTWLIEQNAVPLARLMLSQYAVTYASPEISGPGYLRVGVDRPGVEVFAPGWTTRAKLPGWIELH